MRSKELQVLREVLNTPSTTKEDSLVLDAVFAVADELIATLVIQNIALWQVHDELVAARHAEITVAQQGGINA